MIISHNLSAINAHRIYQKNTRSLNNTLERLSTGLRISKAADDAMNEMSAILNRMRELTVQCANDVNTSEDRQAIQQELNQLQDEINRISTSTEFNGKKLLSGDMAALTSTDDLRTKVQVNGSLATPNGGSAEGNYELKIMARPAGEGQVQKSAQMKLNKNTTIQKTTMVGTSRVKTGNNPPSKPILIAPDNESTGVPTDVTLSWEESTDQNGDAIKYYVYYVYIDNVKNTNRNVTIQGIESTIYQPKDIEKGKTTYYWFIIAKDKHGAVTKSNTFNFITF
ncbi:MAG: flagellin [Thermotogaceae bacterium]|jgi:flagellin-like hook-associated protein FlgL|nr:flagellin [Thermotogaceae bacterium]